MLGSCFVSRDAVLAVSDIVRPEMFYLGKHELIFRAMLDLHQENNPVDLVTMSEALKAAGQLDKIGGVSYLAELCSVVPSAANAEDYAQIVREKWIRRELIKAGHEIMKLARNEDGDLSEQCGRAEQILFGVTQTPAAGKLRLFAEVAMDHWERLHKSRKDPEVTGVQTGYTDLDAILGGLQPGDLVILAARPSQGKTALALNVAEKVVRQQQRKVGFFSLEMSAEALAERLVCSLAQIDSTALRARKLSEGQWDTAFSTVSKIGCWGLYVDDQSQITSLEIRSRARRLKAEVGLDLIVVDYLQELGDRRDKGESRAEQLGRTVRNLKACAKELGVPVLCLAQLGRDVERERRPPRLSDLRESGDIEAAADVALFIHNDAEDPENVRQLIIAKHRNGRTGMIRLHWDKQYSRFALYRQEFSQPKPPPLARKDRRERDD